MCRDVRTYLSSKLESADEIPVVHRLAIIYLILPGSDLAVGMAPVVARNTRGGIAGACVPGGAFRLMEGGGATSGRRASGDCAGMGNGDCCGRHI